MDRQSRVDTDGTSARWRMTGVPAAVVAAFVLVLAGCTGGETAGSPDADEPPTTAIVEPPKTTDPLETPTSIAVDDPGRLVTLGGFSISVPVEFTAFRDPRITEGGPGGSTHGQLFQDAAGRQISVSVNTGNPVTLDMEVTSRGAAFVDVPGIDRRVLYTNSFGADADAAPVDVSGWHSFGIELDAMTTLWVTSSSLTLEELTAVLQGTDAGFR